MTSYFADTSLFAAYLNSRDDFHEVAVQYVRDESSFLVTTSWVLVELGNFVCKSRTRRRFVPFVQDLRTDPFVEILPASGPLLDEALELYHRRPDKQWSVTDCTSILVMRERKLHEALTTDHHFVQAGFRILLK